MEGERMAFVMIATGATSRSPVRTLPVRPLLVAALAAALALLGAGGALGFWVAGLEAPAAGVHAAAPAVVAEPPAPASAYTLEQLGALSARLFRLENEAAQLGRRVGLGARPGAPAPAAAASATGTAGATGGPLLAPRADAGIGAALDSQLAQLEVQIERIADAAALRTIEGMRLPTRLPILGAELTSGFGNRVDPFAHGHAFHAGLDFAAEVGTPIAAAAGGTVAFAGWKPDFGWVVEIDHGNGLRTRYAHSSKLLVRTGDIVAPGDKIARVGSTGRSTGPHLHFEVLRGGDPVDPKRYLAGL
jgi:murein DD-endopeptidase MepM/ murein hydrolase activator NlpD